MSYPSDDARHLARALDALTTQVRRIADTQSTPVAIISDGPDDTPTTPATTCSAQYHGPDHLPTGCIRAAQHKNPRHTDEGGLHWSDAVAVYPVADGRELLGMRVGIDPGIPPGVVVVAHTEPDLSPEASEALGDLVDVAEQQLAEEPADEDEEDDDPPAACWHTEPGTPCDWDICRQPERLAAGDRGTGPASTPPLGPVLRRRAQQTPAADGDTCRPVDVDGETIRVRGHGTFTEQDAQFFGEVVRAAKRRYEAEHNPAAPDTVTTGVRIPLPGIPECGPGCFCRRDDAEQEASTVPCSSALLLGYLHAPHTWQPQPGMESVRCPGGEERLAADGDQTLRWARRESLLVLLTRLQRGRTLTADEATALRQHVEAEIREADTARAAIDRMRRTNRMVNGGARESRERAEQAQAAIERVRAVGPRLEYEATAPGLAEPAREVLRDASRRIRTALDGTEQPTTKA